MYCFSCGNETVESASFCAACGAKVLRPREEEQRRQAERSRSEHQQQGERQAKTGRARTRRPLAVRAAIVGLTLAVLVTGGLWEQRRRAAQQVRMEQQVIEQEIAALEEELTALQQEARMLSSHQTSHNAARDAAPSDQDFLQRWLAESEEWQRQRERMSREAADRRARRARLIEESLSQRNQDRRQEISERLRVLRAATPEVKNEHDRSTPDP